MKNNKKARVRFKGGALPPEAVRDLDKIAAPKVAPRKGKMSKKVAKTVGLKNGALPPEAVRDLDKIAAPKAAPRKGKSQK